jgi:hypothetical protein
VGWMKAKEVENFEIMPPFPFFSYARFCFDMALGTWTCHVKFRVRLLFLDLALK